MPLVPLTILEFEGLSTRAHGLLPHAETLSLRREVLEGCAIRHGHAVVGATLSAATAQLMFDVVRSCPLSTGKPECPANMALATLCAAAFCEKNGRAVEFEGEEGLEVLRLVELVETDRNFRVDRLAQATSLLLPEDSPQARTASIGELGVTAAVGCAVSGLSPDERRKVHHLADVVRRHLHKLGFETQGIVVHDPGDDHPACTTTRNVDLFVAIHPYPSTRLGHQIHGVTDLLTPVLILVPNDVKEITCLFRSTEAGRFFVHRYNNANGAKAGIDEFVRNHSDLLEEHAALRVQRTAWHRGPFLELRSAVTAYLKRNAPASPSSLLTKPIVRHVVSSVDAYSATSVTMINALRVRTGLSPLSAPDESDVRLAELEGLLTPDQAQEFNSPLVREVVPAEARAAVLRAALRQITLHGSGATLRVPTFTSPEHWIQTYRSVSRRPNPRRRP